MFHLTLHVSDKREYTEGSEGAARVHESTIEHV